MELPNSIRKLKHPRHLDLSFTLIQKLPDTVCTLYNVQMLLFLACEAPTLLSNNLITFFILVSPVQSSKRWHRSARHGHIK